eukprot:scaffold1884_cov109-Isochrysis_galbana.AAC.4
MIKYGGESGRMYTYAAFSARIQVKIGLQAGELHLLFGFCPNRPLFPAQIEHGEINRRGLTLFARRPSCEQGLAVAWPQRAKRGGGTNTHFLVSLSNPHITLLRQSLHKWCLSVQCCHSLSCSSSAATPHIELFCAVESSAHMSSQRSAWLKMFLLFVCIGQRLSRLSGWQFLSHSCSGNFAHAASNASDDARLSLRT